MALVALLVAEEVVLVVVVEGFNGAISEGGGGGGGGGDNKPSASFPSTSFTSRSESTTAIWSSFRGPPPDCRLWYGFKKSALKTAEVTSLLGPFNLLLVMSWLCT